MHTKRPAILLAGLTLMVLGCSSSNGDGPDAGANTEIVDSDTSSPDDADGRVRTSDVGGREVYGFSDLAVMAATSDKVVRGTVQNTEPGRVLGGTKFKEIEIAVEDYLLGGKSDGSLVLEIHGWDAAQHEGADIRNPSQYRFRDGASGVFFLHEKQEPGLDEKRYALISTQGVYLLEDEEVEQSERPDGLSRKNEQLSREELLARVREAVSSVERGEVEPQHPAHERTE